VRGRKKELEGKRVTVCAKVSEPTVELIDAARGKQTRSAWLQGVIAASLAEPAKRASRDTPAKPSRALSSGEPLKAGVVVKPETRPRRRCPHPGKRVIGGHCPDCNHMIEPGGYWRE
jgi:hypothetical protein